VVGAQHQGLGRIRLIITADDFGRDEACTRAIAEGLAEGLVTAASIMANGSHFQEACNFIGALRLENRIGVHLCLDEGPALSPEMRSFTRPDGNLRVRRSLKPLGRAFAQALEAELAAQIERVLAAGIRPTHLDSHRHIHTALPIGRVVVRLARRYGIPYVRPARNLAQGGSAAARAYKWMFNRYLAARVATADYFDDLVDFYDRKYQLRSDSLIECMIHLDSSPRGVAGVRLLKDLAFRRFLDNFALVGHAKAY
jgi:predicted glycoside hydrolase/deacetylase ChbG (UPF0249 family)